MKPSTELLMPITDVPEGWRSLSPAIHRGSTVVFETPDAFLDRDARLTDGYSYGQNGSPTVLELAHWIARLEGDGLTVLVPSGLAATVLVNAAMLKCGDRVLVPDTIYGPSQDALLRLFGNWGIATSIYPAEMRGDISRLLAPDVRLVWTESPGSNTLVMQDVPAIAAAAEARNIPVAMDNTWATPLGFRPLDHGVTFSVQALTKYVGGHSDLLMGAVTVKDPQIYRRLREVAELLGYYVSPDECALALRGAGTLALRLERHAQSALTVARWLSHQPAVHALNYPPLPGAPGHELWLRDYESAAGVLSFVLVANDRTSVRRFIEHLRIFRLGASWGGVHSLVSAIPLQSSDAAFLIRLHIGLEDVDDLIADLDIALVSILE